MGMSSVSPDLRELRRFGSYVRNRFSTFHDTVSLLELTWRKKEGKKAAYLYFSVLGKTTTTKLILERLCWRNWTISGATEKPIVR
jgi:hypothetical protein